MASIKGSSGVVVPVPVPEPEPEPMPVPVPVAGPKIGMSKSGRMLSARRVLRRGPLYLYGGLGRGMRRTMVAMDYC